MESLKPGLKNLAQKARKKTLDSARNWLIFVGVLQLLGVVLFYFLVTNQNPGIRMSELIGPLMYIGGIGVAFFVLAFLTSVFPIGSTVIALILFITVHAIDAAIDPTSLARGWILKLIVIIALVKAIQAAVAYEKERKAETGAAPGM